MRTRAMLLPLGISVLAAGIALGLPQGSKSVNDPIEGYKNWNKVNPKPIFMEPAIAVSCVGPSWWDSLDRNPQVPKYFTVYVNSTGKSAMESTRSSKFPAGSVIVKEKFASKDFSHPELLTVMIKHAPGFSKATGDWEYMVVDGDLKKRSEENTKSCQSCHGGMPENDYTFRSYVAGHELPVARQGQSRHE